MTFWQKIRSDFSLSPKRLCLDHAAGGPIPKPVSDAVDLYWKEHRAEADRAWPLWMKRREEMRAVVAKFINADPTEVAFTPNTSHGMNLAADLLAASGPVLVNTAEFPSSTVPWIWRKAKMIWQEPKGYKIDLAEMKKKIGPAKTIVSSYVQYSSGFRQDIEAIGKMKGSRAFVVNATQAFGAFPVDVKKMNADFLMTNSYKWMMAGYGGGIFYISKKWLAKTTPKGLGWRSVKNSDAMNNRTAEPLETAARYELGGPAFPSIFAVGAACRYFQSIGIERIAKRVLELTDFAIEGLERKGYEVASPREPKHRSGIVVFKTPDPDKTWHKLLSAGILTSKRGAGIRIAPHFYNSFEDIEYFLKQLS